MGKSAKPSRARETALSLGETPINLKWKPPPDEDVLARLLLDLVGEDALKETFDE